MLNYLLYRTYRLATANRYWRTRYFTSAGFLVLGALAASAVIGLDTTRMLAYQAFSFLAAMLLLSIICSFFFRARFFAQRLLPRFATVNKKLKYRIVVKNSSGQKQSGLLIAETRDPPYPGFQEFESTPEPGEKNRNPFDRVMKFHRWQWLLLRKTHARSGEQPLPDIVPNGSVEVSMEMLPLKRGYIRLNGITIARPDPFGLVKSCLTLPLPQSVLVLPKRYTLPPVSLSGSRKYQPGGVALASSVGDSQEFMSMRDYRPGDPIRHIHWKSWAKTGKPIVKEYQDEYFVRHALILDTFQSEHHSEIFEEAVSIAASFACTVQTRESLLDLMFIGPQAYCFTAGRGLSHTDRMLEILASVTPCTDKPFENLVSLTIRRAELLSSCICIFLSWDEQRKKFAEMLNKFDITVLAFVVCDGPLQKDSGENTTANKGLVVHRLYVGRIEEGLAKV